MHHSLICLHGTLQYTILVLQSCHHSRGYCESKLGDEFVKLILCVQFFTYLVRCCIKKWDNFALGSCITLERFLIHYNQMNVHCFSALKSVCNHLLMTISQRNCFPLQHLIYEHLIRLFPSMNHLSRGQLLRNPK